MAERMQSVSRGLGKRGTERPRAARWLRRIADGIGGGLVATVVMTAFRASISTSLPPTAEFWATYVGGDPDDHAVAAAVLHLAYGAAAGVAYVAATPLGVDDEYRAERRGALTGVGYGLVLSAFGERVLVERVLDVDLAPDERLVFHLGHVVYGLTLGTWAGSRIGG